MTSSKNSCSLYSTFCILAKDLLFVISFIYYIIESFFADSVMKRSELAAETLELFLYMFARMHRGDRISNDLLWEISKKIGHHFVVKI